MPQTRGLARALDCPCRFAALPPCARRVQRDTLPVQDNTHSINSESYVGAPEIGGYYPRLFRA